MSLLIIVGIVILAMLAPPEPRHQWWHKMEDPSWTRRKHAKRS